MTTGIPPAGAIRRSESLTEAQKGWLDGRDAGDQAKAGDVALVGRQTR